MIEPKTSALIAKCGMTEACGYAWIIAFLPMDMAAVGKASLQCVCPMCGDPRPQIGRPADLHPTLLSHLTVMLTQGPKSHA